MRLIDANALEKDGWMMHRNRRVDEKTMVYETKRPTKFPTVEPERKTGKWIDEGFYADGHGVHAFRCSECGGHIIEYDPDPFCKWCGADMRGEQDE